MDVAVPWVVLAAFSAALLALALLTTLVAAREALGEDAVRVVKTTGRWTEMDRRAFVALPLILVPRFASADVVYPAVLRGVPLHFSARSRQPPGVSDRMVVRHGSAARFEW